MKNIAVIVAVLAVLGAAIYFLAGGEGGSSELGQGVPAGAQVIAVRDLNADPQAYKGKEVTVKGRLAEVCPTSGCWGVVNDGSGTVRWDSANSGWTMPSGQLGKEITVRGSVSLNEAGAPELTALGARL